MEREWSLGDLQVHESLELNIGLRVDFGLRLDFSIFVNIEQGLNFSNIKDSAVIALNSTL